jgi:hypothetical protein
MAAAQIPSNRAAIAFFALLSRLTLAGCFLEEIDAVTRRQQRKNPHTMTACGVSKWCRRDESNTRPSHYE